MMPILPRHFPPHLGATLVFTVVVGCSACSSTPSPDGAPPAPRSSEVPDASPPDLAAEWVPAELSTLGWDALSGAPVVLLRETSGGQVLPIWIGLAEARAIGMALNGIEPPRPMTHDLLASVLAKLNATLEEVVVTELRDSTYYGLLKIRVDGEAEARWIDTRPSDGLALALRTGARIRVAAALVRDQPDFQFLPPELPDQVVRVLGLTVRAMTPELRREYELPERDGLVVIAVQGEAERRGLALGDLIVGLNGEVPDEPVDLLDAIRESPRGVLSLTYWRNGEEKTIELDLSAEEPEEKEGLVA